MPLTSTCNEEPKPTSHHQIATMASSIVYPCTRQDFEDRYFLDALYYLQEAEEVSNVGVCGFGAAPLALAQKNGLAVSTNMVICYYYYYYCSSSPPSECELSCFFPQNVLSIFACTL